MRRRFCNLCIVYTCMQLLLSCGFDSFLEVEHPLQVPRAVLNATLCPDSIISASISHTGGKLQFEQWTDEKDYYIDDASVEVIINGVSKGVMSKDSMPGKYILPNTYPTAGDHVLMKVQAKGFEPISSEVQIPTKNYFFAVDTFGFQHGSWSSSDSDYFGIMYSINIDVSINDLKKEQNYYMLTINESDTANLSYGHRTSYTIKTFYDSEMVLFDRSSYYYYFGSAIIFSDELINGETCTFNITTSKFTFINEMNEIKNTYKINLYSISESYYRYRYSKILQYDYAMDLLGGFGMREPIPTYSNVKNGYGLLAAVQVATYEIPISHLILERR